MFQGFRCWRWVPSCTVTSGEMLRAALSSGSDRSVCIEPALFNVPRVSLLAVGAKLHSYFRRDAAGSPVKWFRPVSQAGHGWYTKRMRQQAQRHGYNVALGSVFPVDPLFKDSSRPLAAYCLWKVLTAPVEWGSKVASICCSGLCVPRGPTSQRQ
ncbi:unnamed protein product [Closterium sp. NIES-54]